MARIWQNGTGIPISAVNLNALEADVTTALSREPAITPGTAAQYFRGDKTMQTLNAAAVGLGAVNNTADSAKPVSAPQQTALDLKFNKASAPISVRDMNAVGNGTTDDTASFQAAITAAPSGGVVWIPASTSTYKITGTITIDKPLTILNMGGKLNYTATGISMFSITSSDVSIFNVVASGIGIAGTRVDGSNAVLITGTLASPLKNVRIEGNTFTGFADSGIWANYLTYSRIVGNYVADVLYAAIMTLTLTDSLISENVISNVVQKAPVVNTYGIAVSDVDNTIAARSANIAITNNIVEFVRDWEGIDTHGAINVTITGNVVTGCRDGIAAVAGNATRVCAPENTIITGNTLDSTGANSPRSGIRLIGVDSTTKASGSVVGNVIRGTYGTARIELGSFDVDKTQFDRFVSWTPTWTGLTLGNGTQSCKYTRNGDMVTCVVSVTLGSTSAVTGLFDFTVPVPFGSGVITYQALGQGTLVDTSVGGAGRYNATPIVLSLSGRVYFTHGSNTQSNNTAPFTWADGDKITCVLNYEAAVV